jgi:hypothetical protein
MKPFTTKGMARPSAAATLFTSDTDTNIQAYTLGYNHNHNDDNDDADDGSQADPNSSHTIQTPWLSLSIRRRLICWHHFHLEPHALHSATSLAWFHHSSSLLAANFMQAHHPTQRNTTHLITS